MSLFFFMPELIEDTQAHQAKINQACQNVSSPNFQAAELWKKMKWTIVKKPMQYEHSQIQSILI